MSRAATKKIPHLHPLPFAKGEAKASCGSSDNKIGRPQPATPKDFASRLRLQGGSRSGLFPAVPVACHCVLRRELSLFRFFLNVRHSFLVMLFGDEHVERWNDEEREDCSDSHPANQDQ